MAALAGAIVTRILGHSAVEKAFTPWWDNLKDYLVYGVVMLGKSKSLMYPEGLVSIK